MTEGRRGAHASATLSGRSSPTASSPRPYPPGAGEQRLPLVEREQKAARSRDLSVLTADVSRGTNEPDGPATILTLGGADAPRRPPTRRGACPTSRQRCAPMRQEAGNRARSH